MNGTGETLSAADIAAVTRNNDNGGGFLGNNDGGFWLLILFLFAMMGGWGNNGGYGGGGNCANAAAIPAVQAGFDQAAVMNGINGINNSLAAAEISRANTQSNISNQINGLAASLQNCCCENRLGTADLKYTVATEACADRQAINEGLRDILTNNTANTQTVVNALTQGFQAVQDKLCQQEIDALKTQLQEANTRNYLNSLYSSQNQQTQQILADNALQTAALEQYLAPTPRPAYIVQNPNCCQQNMGCGGCGNF